MLIGSCECGEKRATSARVACRPGSWLNAAIWRCVGSRFKSQAVGTISEEAVQSDVCALSMSDTRLKTRKTIVADEVFAVAHDLANEQYFIVKAIARNQALNAGESVWQAQAGFETEFGPIQTGDSVIKIWKHVPVTFGSSF